MAFSQARKLLEDEPGIRKVRQLGIFEEVIIHELQQAFYLLHLYKVAEKNDIPVLRFSSSSKWSQGLIEMVNLFGVV